jgi:hypothetical protein
VRTLIRTVTFALTILSGGAVVAQTTELPTISPSEQQVQDINRSLQEQGRRLQQDEQNQFNTDQMQLYQGRLTDRNVPSTRLYRRGCPTGSVGC